MKKTLLLVLSAILLSPIAVAEDLSLRVAMVGYEDAEDGPVNQRRPSFNLRKLIPGHEGCQNGAGDRKETILRSIETKIIPGEEFSVSSVNGAEILGLRGSSTRGNDSNLRINLIFKHSKITADAIEAMRSAEGDASKVQRIMNLLPGTASQTMITLKPGDSEDLGEVSRVSQGVDAKKKSSAFRIVVSLVDRDMDRQMTAEPSDEPKPR